MSVPVRPKNQLFGYLRNTDNSNQIVMNVNGSSTPQAFKYICPPGEIAVIRRINIQMRATSLDFQDFGGITNGLTNGVTPGIYDANDNLLFDYTEGQNWKKNADIVLSAGIDVLPQTSAGADFLFTRWTLANSGGEPVLYPGEYFAFVINDDLTSLAIFCAMIQGRLHKLTGAASLNERG